MASEESPAIPIDDQSNLTSEDTESKMSQINIEKMEEEKLKARYTRPVTGHSAFLQKRLAKGQKYFDSGDYQMAKQKGPAKISNAAPTATAVVPPTEHPTGETIPTPESVPTRKTSIIQSKLASPAT